MIVPRTRVIAVTAAAGSALALSAALLRQSAVLCLVLAVLLALAIAIDAFRALDEARGLGAQASPLIRVVRGRAFELPVTVFNRGTRPASGAQIALQLPETVSTSAATLDCGSPGPGQQVGVSAVLTCTERGEFRIVNGVVRATSAWKFWDAQRTVQLDTTIRSYPDLLSDPTAAEFLQRGKAGERVMRHSGKGREFEKLREYTYGDSFDEIDWKATARRGQPVVKVFQVERTQEIYVAIDTSRLSGRRDGERSTLDRYVYASLVMAIAAESQGDRFGLITFSDRIHNFVRAQKGKAHFKTCREAIYNAQPRAVEADFGEFFSFIQTRLTRRALIIVLTSLDDPLAAETFSRNADLGRRHLLIAAMPMPAGTQPLFESPAPDVNAIYEKLGGHLRWRQLAELQKACRRKGVALHLLSPERLTGQLAGIYLDVKRRQLL